MDILNKNYQLDELKSTKVLLENKIIELETLNFKTEEAKKKIQYEMQLLKENFVDLQKKQEQLKIDLQSSLAKSDEFEKQLNYRISENEELQRRLSFLESENDRMKLVIDEIKAHNFQLKQSNENNGDRLNDLQNLVQEVKITLHSSFSISKVFIHKYITVINEDLTHSYSKGFCEVIERYANMSSILPSEINPLEIIKKIEDFMRCIGTELEVLIKLM